MERVRTMITAHAGAEDTVPNSMESICALCGLGVDAIEVDVRRVGGKLVLSHDVPADGEVRAALEDCLCEAARHGDLKVNLDLKEFGLVRDVAEWVERCGMKGRVILTGDASDEEAEFARRAGMEVWRNASNLPEGMALSEAVEGGEVLNLHFPDAEALLSGAARSLSLWTVGDEGDMRRYFAAGVLNVTTRSPKTALRVRGEIK